MSLIDSGTKSLIYRENFQLLSGKVNDYNINKQYINMYNLRLLTTGASAGRNNIYYSKLILKEGNGKYTSIVSPSCSRILTLPDYSIFYSDTSTSKQKLFVNKTFTLPKIIFQYPVAGKAVRLMDTIWNDFIFVCQLTDIMPVTNRENTTDKYFSHPKNIWHD